MSNNTYKVIELVGSSDRGIEQAIQNAVAQAGSSLRNMRWFEVVQTRGHLDGGKIAHFQVHLKVGLTVETQA